MKVWLARVPGWRQVDEPRVQATHGRGHHRTQRVPVAAEAAAVVLLLDHLEGATDSGAAHTTATRRNSMPSQAIIASPWTRMRVQGGAARNAPHLSLLLRRSSVLSENNYAHRDT